MAAACRVCWTVTSNNRTPKTTLGPGNTGPFLLPFFLYLFSAAGKKVVLIITGSIKRFVQLADARAGKLGVQPGAVLSAGVQVFFNQLAIQHQVIPLAGRICLEGKVLRGDWAVETFG